MHPDLYLVVYRQAERELDRRVERARVARERHGSPSSPARSRRPVPALSVAALRGLVGLRRRMVASPEPACCAA